MDAHVRIFVRANVQMKKMRKPQELVNLFVVIDGDNQYVSVPAISILIHGAEEAKVFLRLARCSQVADVYECGSQFQSRRGALSHQT